MHTVVHYVPTVNMWNVFEKIIQVWFSNHLRAKRKETPVGQCWCHGWTHMNHIYISALFFILFFFFASFNLKHNLTVRECWDAFRVSTPKGWKKIRMSNVPAHITNASLRNCTDILREVEGSFRDFFDFSRSQHVAMYDAFKIEKIMVMTHFTLCWLWLLLCVCNYQGAKCSGSAWKSTTLTKLSCYHLSAFFRLTGWMAWMHPIINYNLLPIPLFHMYIQGGW